MGLSEGQRGFVSECVCNDECWRNSTLKFCFVIEGCYILYKNTFAFKTETFIALTSQKVRKILSDDVK